MKQLKPGYGQTLLTNSATDIAPSALNVKLIP